MRIEILEEMSKDELIEYCVALNDCLYIEDKVSELRSDINRAQTIIAGYNESLRERLVEQTSAVNRLEVMEADLMDTYRGHIKPAKIKPYRQSEQLDVEVMDLNNDPETDKKQEPKYKVGDVVWVNGLMGRWEIFGIDTTTSSKTGDWIYELKSYDNSDKPEEFREFVSESRILSVDTETIETNVID